MIQDLVYHKAVVDYLNQGLPSISGIFPPVAGINPIKPSPDDPQGIVSLYPICGKWW
jgi:hypothetical protein